MRTGVRHSGLRSDAATIAATVRARPLLLVTGMVGFALRGGIVLLLLPILVLPTSVEVRLLLGGNLGTTGLTTGFYLIVGVLSAATMAAAMVVLYILARCELAAFKSFVEADSLAADEHGPVVSRLFVVEAVAFLALLVAAIPLAVAIGQATLAEILLPSSADSIYARIFNDVTVPLAGWFAGLVIVEAVSAVATRSVLIRSFGLSPASRLGRHPVRVAAIALIGWLLFIGAFAPAAIALAFVWQGVESVFLSGGMAGGLREIVSAVLVALMFGALFTVAFAMCGLVSAVRAGLWTLASLR